MRSFRAGTCSTSSDDSSPIHTRCSEDAASRSTVCLIPGHRATWIRSMKGQQRDTARMDRPSISSHPLKLMDLSSLHRRAMQAIANDVSRVQLSSCKWDRCGRRRASAATPASVSRLHLASVSFLSPGLSDPSIGTIGARDADGGNRLASFCRSTARFVGSLAR